MEADNFERGEVTPRQIGDLKLEDDRAHELAQSRRPGRTWVRRSRRKTKSRGSGTHFKSFRATPAGEVVHLVDDQQAKPIAVLVEAAVGAFESHHSDGLDLFHPITDDADRVTELRSQNRYPLFH
jgi:hypothetical protein